MFGVPNPETTTLPLDAAAKFPKFVIPGGALGFSV
jgi:hypothetical protein